MPDNERKKREAPISYRPPVALAEEFAARVQNSGLSTSRFITQAVFGNDAPRARRKPSIEAAELARLNIQLARLIDALKEDESEGNNAQDSDALITDIHLQVGEIRTALFKALGRHR